MQKPKTFRPWQPEQTSLLPPSPSDWLSDDHQVYFLLDLVDELDLSQVLIPAQSKDPRGEKGFDPRMMTLLLLYAYCVGIVSSRKIERACYEDLAFRVLTANQQPDHSRISEFRRQNLEALSELFVQILRLCQKAGMVSLGHVALDGTKVQANASKHKAMSHARMLKAEKQLEKEINALMRRAEILDALEALPKAPIVEHSAVLAFVERNALMGRGLGWVDMHLLASASASGERILTRDRRLEVAARDLGLAHEGLTS